MDPGTGTSSPSLAIVLKACNVVDADVLSCRKAMQMDCQNVNALELWIGTSAGHAVIVARWDMLATRDGLIGGRVK